MRVREDKSSFFWGLECIEVKEFWHQSQK